MLSRFIAKQHVCLQLFLAVHDKQEATQRVGKGRGVGGKI